MSSSNCIETMKQFLQFLKGFRSTRGFDGEVEDLLEDNLTNLPPREGVYIITSHSKKFIYPWGESKVIYIGKSNSIRRRLNEHHRAINRKSQDWDADKHNYMREYGASAVYYLTLGKQDSKNLESEILYRFFSKYGAMPVGNAARSFHRHPNLDD